MKNTLQSFSFSSTKSILFVALFVRLIAAVLSQGYGMHDDHFLVIEMAGSWVDDMNYSTWLPWSESTTGHPEGHSFTYVGLNFILFYLLKIIGLTDPYWMMFVNRIVHALFSVLVVYFGMKITEKLATKELAIKVGWVLALMWLMPFMSVRNLVELTSVPFLMAGVWLLISRTQTKYFFVAGLLMGMAVSFRYQIGVFLVGIAVIYFFQREWRKLLSFCSGVLVLFFITQGLVDWAVWGYPFAEFIGYVTYNMNEGTEYMANKNYFMYFYVLFGVLLVPMAPLALIGFFKSAKNQWFLFLPTLLFLLFHTLYPNRQERFILSILPFVVILAFIGIDILRRKSLFWDKFWKLSWSGFWLLNIPLLVFFTISSTKLSRVEAMYSMYNNQLNDELILIEATGDVSPSLLPVFYGKCWECYVVLRTDTTQPLDRGSNRAYDYLFFLGEENLDNRIQQYKSLYPKMTLDKVCLPSLMDRILHDINPRNSNEYIEVWNTHSRQ